MFWIEKIKTKKLHLLSFNLIVTIEIQCEAILSFSSMTACIAFTGTCLFGHPDIASYQDPNCSWEEANHICPSAFLCGKVIAFIHALSCTGMPVAVKCRKTLSVAVSLVDGVSNRRMF